MKHLTRTLCTWALAAAAPAWAQQSANDLEMLNKYAGSWAVDCSRSDATRLTVGPKALKIAAGGKQVQANAPPLAAVSWFGRQQPPAGFEAALLADAPNTQLVFLAMRDKTGPYLTVEADGPLQKQFGQAALAGKFRPCP
jgi:hypothetical protein